jgi:hypothetical protein
VSGPDPFCTSGVYGHRCGHVCAIYDTF